MIYFFPEFVKRSVFLVWLCAFFTVQANEGKYYDALRLLQNQPESTDTIFQLCRLDMPENCDEAGQWTILKVHSELVVSDLESAQAYLDQYHGACASELVPGLIYFQAVLQYLKLDFESSIASFLHVRPIIQNKYNAYTPLVAMNLGSAYNNLGILDSAIYFYDECYRWYGDSVSALVLNNIASIKIKLAEYPDALHYLSLASKQLRKGEIDVQQMIEINRLYVLFKTGETEKAQQTFMSLDKTRLPSGAEIQALRTLLGYCISQDDTSSFYNLAVRHQDLFQDRSTYSDSLFFDIFRAIKGNAPFVASLWQAGKQADMEPFKYQYRVKRSATDQTLSALYNRWRRTALLLGFILLISVLVFLVSVWKWRSENKALSKLIEKAKDQFSQNDSIQKIKRALEGKGSKKEAVNALLEMDYALSLQQLSYTQKQEIPWELFDPTETEIIKLMIQRKSTKEIALLRKCSVGHVYNVKSKIRRKLNLPDQPKALELWLSELPLSS